MQIPIVESVDGKLAAKRQLRFRPPEVERIQVQVRQRAAGV